MTDDIKWLRKLPKGLWNKLKYTQETEYQMSSSVGIYWVPIMYQALDESLIKNANEEI